MKACIVQQCAPPGQTFFLQLFHVLGAGLVKLFLSKSVFDDMRRSWASTGACARLSGAGRCSCSASYWWSGATAMRPPLLPSMCRHSSGAPLQMFKTRTAISARTDTASTA